MAKDKEYMHLINSTRWLQLRRQVLTAHPCCQRCEKMGRITAATEVHHIHPVEEAFTHDERRRRAYDPHNLMALCHACHVEVHKEMGKGTKAATKERTEKQVKEIIDKFF